MVRKKKKQLVITFSTTTEAMKTEKFCMEKNLPGRMIPVPREISAGCGLSWKVDPEEKDRIQKEFEQAGITFEAMQIVEI